MLSAAANLGPFSFAYMLWVFTPGGNAEIDAAAAKDSLESNPNGCLLFTVLHHLLLEQWAVMKVVKEVNYFARTIIMWKKPCVPNSPYYLLFSYFLSFVL